MWGRKLSIPGHWNHRRNDMGGAGAFCDADSEKEAMVRSMDLILKPWGATEGFKRGSDS